MSNQYGYPPQGGYPPQPGYPDYPTQQGYPPQQLGFPQPGYPPTAMPDPYGGGGGGGGLPYPSQPSNIGFPQPQFPSAVPGIPGGYPSQQQPGYPPAGGGYPPQAGGGYPGAAPPAAGGYPPAGGGGYPPATGGGYPPAPSGGYPPATGGGYPSATGGGYPPATGGGYSPATGGGYPPATGGGYPPAIGGGYPPAPSGSYPPAAGGGYQPAASGVYPPAGGGYQGMPPGGPGYNTPAMPPNYNTQPMIQETGTIRPSPNFNAEEDAKILRKAMKGLGTDEKAIIDVLSCRSNSQRLEIKNRFKTMYGKDLIKDLKSELSGHFEVTILALMMSPTEYDAEQLREAMKGAGTNESTLIEILCTRNNRQIIDIKNTYKMMFQRDLEKDLMSETSGHFRRLLVSLSTGNRMENQPVDINKAKQDAMELYQAGEKMLGTDESKFNQILCSQGYQQLRLVFQEYKNLSKKGLDQVIKSEMSGDLEKGMLAIFSVVENKHRFFAEKLYHSMKGAGTKDSALIRVIVSRCEVDMVQIKQEYQRLFGKSVEASIEGDTSGDYKKVLLALVRGY